MTQKYYNKIIYKFLTLLFIVLFLFIAYQNFDIKFVINAFESNYNRIGSFAFSTAILIFTLRSLSILIPILPGTYCSVIAGYIYGIKTGLIIIFFADFLACSISFILSRRLGRGFVKKLLGSTQMNRVERISKNYLEDNFFLMTGLLMTQFFDFVCYAIGLTKISWKKFMPALILSILISDAPFVAGGYTIQKIQDVSLRQILNGEISSLDGPYLLIFLISFLTIICLGLFNMKFNKKRKLN
ncbi:TVP38/TMEM64 family protein [Prochlorococcus marinus]|uniref:TVP38/TMEM64 family protein n=1 Tax=Prochlorococcus marinus TaxID=1219 RepID=UPI0022B5763F|nr:VTT domain-containing protein [Prochlorococcus marinus]